MGLFQKTKAVPAMAAARIQRWGLILGAHQHTIKYKPGQQKENVDVLSRLPAEKAEDTNCQSEQVLSTSLLDSNPPSRQQLEGLIKKYPVLMEVRHRIEQGWPRKVKNSKLQSFWRLRQELTADNGLICRGDSSASKEGVPARTT